MLRNAGTGREFKSIFNEWKCSNRNAPTEMYQQKCTNRNAPTEMYQQECTNRNVPTEMYQQKCTNRNAPTEMYQQKCTNRNVPTEMYQQKCTNRNAPTEMHQQKCTNGNVQMLSVIPVFVNSSFFSSKSVGKFCYIPSNSFTQSPYNFLNFFERDMRFSRP
jgi:hypothetical protein